MTIVMLESYRNLESYRKEMHILCTELQPFKKCKHFSMQITDNGTFEYNNNYVVVQSGGVFFNLMKIYSCYMVVSL